MPAPPPPPPPLCLWLSLILGVAHLFCFWHVLWSNNELLFVQHKHPLPHYKWQADQQTWMKTIKPASDTDTSISVYWSLKSIRPLKGRLYNQGLRPLIVCSFFHTLLRYIEEDKRDKTRGVPTPSIGWFSNRTGTSVDDGARKSNNWLNQWQSGKLGTGCRI